MQTRFWITETSGGAQRVPPCLLIRNWSLLICRTCFPLEEPALLTITRAATSSNSRQDATQRSPDYLCTDGLAEQGGAPPPQYKALFLSTVSKSVKFDEWARC